jgi:hypothetical protein
MFYEAALVLEEIATEDKSRKQVLSAATADRDDV